MDVKLFVEGGRTWREGLEETLKKAKVPESTYQKDPEGVIARLTRRGFIVQAVIADDTNRLPIALSAGVRWQGLLAILERTEARQLLINIDGQQYLPQGSKHRILKNSSTLPVKSWETEPPGYNQTLREGLEQVIEGIDITKFTTTDNLPVGFKTEGVRTNNINKVMEPFNWVRGEAMYKDPAMRKNAKIVGHVGKNDYSAALNQGMLVTAEKIPTLSGDTDPHKVTLKHVPFYHIKSGVTVQTKKAGRDMTVQDDCFWDTYSDYSYSRTLVRPAFGRTESEKEENIWDHHADFTLRGTADWVRANHPDFAIDFPFPNVSDRVKRLVEIAYHRLSVTTRTYKEGSNEPIITRELMGESVAWMKIFTMMAVAYDVTTRRQEQYTASRGRTLTRARVSS